MIGVVGCVRCGRRQVDPDSGPSLWKRGVRLGEQVLVCPECQTDGWTDLLDRCARCRSTALVKRLGEVSCRGCGAVDDVVASSVLDPRGAGSGGPDRSGGTPLPSSGAGGMVGREALAADVAAALDRVLGSSLAPPVEER